VPLHLVEQPAAQIVPPPAGGESSTPSSHRAPAHGQVDANEVPDLYFLKSRSMGVLENVAAPFPPRSAKAETSPLKRTHQEHYPA